MNMRTLIRNGILIDPAEGIQTKSNLLIENGKIKEITKTTPEADEIIDAEGFIVCPGFIDLHMHEDPVGEDNAISWNIFPAMLRMGVTTAVGGNCGINLYDPLKYLDIIDHSGAPVNVMLLAGHKYFRERAGATDKYGPVTPKQLESVKEGLREALHGGCAGISYGLPYVPGTDMHELSETASCCVPDRKLLAVHVDDDAAGVFEAASRLVRTVSRLDVPIELSHIGSMAGYGQMEAFLEQIDDYRAKGIDITCDCYPYDQFSTRIGSGTYDEGWRDRYHCGYDVCEICDGKYAGQRCTKEIFEELRNDFPQCLTVCYVMKDEDIETAYDYSDMIVASDGILDGAHGHPRATGTFPHFLAKYVREGSLGLIDGIARITSLPAARMGLADKGRLDPGADADLVIFDPETIRDCSTFAEPMLAPVGIQRVIIGGRTAVIGGEIVNESLGRSLRK